MPNPTDVTGSIELADFSPGIRADFHGGITSTSRGSVSQNGAAVIDGTVGCCSDSTGALVPLPASALGKSDATIYLIDDTSHHPSARRAAYIADAYITPAATDSVLSVAGLGANYSYYGSVSVATLYQHWTAFDGSGANYSHAWLGRMYRYGTLSGGGNVIDFLWDSTHFGGSTDDPHDLYSGSLHGHRSYSSSSGVSDATLQNFGIVACVAHHGHSAVTAIAANELAYTTFDTDISGNYPTRTPGSDGYLMAFPDPTNRSTDSIYALAPGTIGSLYAIGHQGRTISYDRYIDASGHLSFYANDRLSYTAVLDFRAVLGVDKYTFVPSPEVIADYGIMASCSVDELLLIKALGGGVLIRGDLDNPTLVNLPNIDSTYGVSAMPINTPIGLVYGTRNGVYVWAGGETTTKLSNQIEGFFWDHTSGAIRYEAHAGRFGWFHPWVCVPNNFIYDTRSKAWWRLQSAAGSGAVSDVPYSVYAVDSTSGKLLAFPYKVDATHTTVYDTFDPAVLANSYSWRSQPLIETLTNTLSFRDMTLVASPGANNTTQTVTVTLTGYDKDGNTSTPATTTFTFINHDGSGSPSIQRQDIHDTNNSTFTAMYVTARVQASAVSGPAPKIHRINIGYGERARSPKQ